MEATTPTPPPASGPASSRRRLLRLAGAAVAGATASSIAAQRASAIDGLAIDISGATTATDFVLVTSTETGAAARFHFKDSSSGSTNASHNNCVLATSSGNGVMALSVRSSNETAALLRSTAATGARISGTTALRLETESTASPHHVGFAALAADPYSRAFAADTLDLCADGLWLAVGDGSSPQWRKLAGADTAGAYHPIATARVYDSRKDMTPMASGTIGTGGSRTISVADRRDPASGAVTTTNVVPAHATAVTFNLTVVSTVGSNGFLSVEPGDAVTFGGSTINWFGPNQILANGNTAKLDDDRQLKVFCGGTATSTHFVLDIVGYYL